MSGHDTCWHIIYIMKIHKSIDKRVKRVLTKINKRYHLGINTGRPTTYYLHPSFLPLYLKRVAWLIVSLLTLKKSTYKTFWRIIGTKHFPHLYYTPDQKNNRLKELIRVLFGYRLLYDDRLYPAYPANTILKTKRIEYPFQSDPLVSIVITVFDKLSYTYNCLQTIYDNVSSNIHYEVIVIDDCSTDETPQFLINNTKNLQYIKNTGNVGYLQSNNKACDYVKGKYICFLNNDTQVQSAWLESMLELIENDNEVGAVGSKLLYPNGLLQEAGGIIFKNGEGANFGRMKDPQDSSYNFIREVDYCSAASLLVRKEDFVKVGKFDLQFSPAYYEDTDLCFAIRNKLGKKVMYQPLSTVIHFEGISSGKEVKEGAVKNYQKINQLKFKEKWRHVLAEHGHPEDSLSYRRLMSKDTIVVVEWMIPTFDKDSGSLRLYRILDILISLNYHVIFIPEDGNRDEPYYSALMRMGIEVRVDFNSRSSVSDFKALEYLLFVKFVWISRPELNILYKEKLSYLRNIKWIYDTVDLHHVRMLREKEFKKDDSHKIDDIKKMRDLEYLLANEADASITVTETEKQVMEANGAKNVYVVPNIHVPYDKEQLRSFGDRSGLLFIGGYSHTPNVDAVCWLVKEIMPLVWQKAPNIPLYLLGSNPPKEVLDLANERIFVPGYIKDVSPFFLKSKVFVAPLRYGAGMKGKVGQSLEFRLPVVTTSIGAEGMSLQNEKHVLIADDPFKFAAQILRIYQEKELWEKISNASEKATSQYSPQTVKNLLRELFEDIEASTNKM